jgi:tetratricopeptide (TPR) repeat protein
VAEGLLGGLIGGEEESAEVEAGENRVSAEAFAASLAADQAKHDPLVARAAEAFLDQQKSLLKAQEEELQEQRAIRLSHLHSQSREGKIRRVGQRIRVGIQAFTVLILTVIGCGVLVMLHDAFTSRSVVVDAFKAPSALAGRGVTGEVVAAGVLDTLQKLQDATRSPDASLNTQGAWASDVKIEVPETGVSIGEVNRLLHQRFGHDLHIGGDLVQTDTGGLALTVRGDKVPASTFTGGPGDLDKLTTQAAEYVYGRSQPAQYAVYLVGAGRNADAIAFLAGAYPRASTDDERAKLAHHWANAYSGLNQPLKAVEKQRLAMSLVKPRSTEWWVNWSNMVASVTAVGGEEAGWRESAAFLRAFQAAPKDQRPETKLLENAAQNTWDLPLLLAANLADAASHNGAGNTSAIEGPQIAEAYALMHDPAQSARYLTASDPDDSTTKAEALLLQGYDALDRGDATAAIPPLEGFYKAWLADPNLQFTYGDNACFLGLAYGLAGRMGDAEPVFKKPGAWSRCYAFHGDALAHAGDVAGAERVWAEGLKIAPDLPQVYLHRGVFELDHGDLRAAEADLSTAAAKAPHYADPLKAWGDLLVREGQWKAALTKYDAALKYAPAWAELHQARDAAARRV